MGTTPHVHVSIRWGDGVEAEEQGRGNDTRYDIREAGEQVRGERARNGIRQAETPARADG